MIYVILNNPARRVRSGHLSEGTLKHMRPQEWEYSKECTFEVQADGDELVAILDQFNGIPFSKKARVQSWDGDIAKFIALHLC